MENNAVAVLCTRPDSSRLPRKCFKKIAGKDAIEHILDRLIPTGLNLILAIPDGLKSMYAKYEKEFSGVYIFEGNPESPLHRTADALHWYSRFSAKIPKYVVRITHDDILIDSQTIKEMLQDANEHKGGYVFSPEIVEGAGVEIIHTSNIFYAAETHKEPTEYISYFVKSTHCPENSMCIYLPRSSIRRNYRLTLDYPEDAIVLETVLRSVGANASVDSICSFLDQNQGILNYNRLPDLSVYTCTHNSDKWISKTIASALYSHDANIQYILVDDYSTDKTLEKISELSHGFDLILNEENIGLASSSNKALRAAKSRYVLRLDADDILLPSAIDKMISAIKKSGAAIVYSNYHEIDEDGKILKENCPGNIHHHAGCAIMDKKFIDQVRFTENLKHWDSLDLFNRIKNKYPIAYIEEPLWLYRQHSGSLSKSNSEERESAKRNITQ